jgi:hypothetical protein
MPRGVKRGSAVVDGEMDQGRGVKRGGSFIGASGDGSVLQSKTLEDFVNNPEEIVALLMKNAKDARKKAESSKAEAQSYEKLFEEADEIKTLLDEAAEKALTAKHDAAKAAVSRKAEADEGKAAYEKAKQAYQDAKIALQHVRTLGAISKNTGLQGPH